jgi:hypothetical protein
MPEPLQFTSGKWVGFYRESHRRDPGWMQLYLVCDESGSIRGEGVDYVGPWTLQGQFDGDTGRCFWVKQYVRQHSVAYDGQLNADGIVGDWRIKPFLHDTFHIWPESQTHLTERFLHAPVPLPNPVPTA